MALTEQQQAIVSSGSEALKVVAFAGAGKTSTLRAYAQARPGRRMLYLAFNRAIAREATGKFTPNVTCLTTHSLAFRAVGHTYSHKLANNIRANQVAQALGLNPGDSSVFAHANKSLRALEHFLSTSCTDLHEFAELVEGEKEHEASAIEGAARLWQAMRDPANQAMPMLHDGYLKLFQLSAPRLEYDTILFDEAQDANPVTLAIVRQQSSAKVFVGDPHQQIYQFRYAENAMEDPSITDELVLTESFRFGDEIAAAANRLLAVKRERNCVRGRRRVQPSSTKAFIARGNAALYKHAALLAHQGKKVCWVGKIDGYRLDLLNDIWHLKAGRRSEIRDRFVAGFKDFDALQGYASSQDARDLKAWIRVIEGHARWQTIPEEIALVRSRSVAQPEGGTLILATAHKSKGLEFGSVELADDFPEAELANPVTYSRDTHSVFWGKQGFRGGVMLPVEEINLRYVAITRAETTCSSGQWPAPMFSGLADYVRRHPRFLTLEEATKLRSGVAHEAVPEDVPNQAAPRSAKPKSKGAVDVAALVAAYTKGYPLLRWDLLAERFRLEGGDVQALLRGHPLQSAQKLVAAFVGALAAGGQHEAAAEQEPTPTSEGSTSPEPEPPNPELPDLISAEYGLAPVVMQERFNSSGWSEAGRVQTACPRCATKPMVAFKRPRTTQTFDQWYQKDWALFCTNCALLSEAADVQQLRVQKPQQSGPEILAVIRSGRS
jgi:F-box protein 18 (helicase)